LFNDTILYNITYGRVDATEEEVEHGVCFFFEFLKVALLTP